MAKAGTKYSALGTKPEARETNGTRKWEGGAAAGQFPTERSRATDCARGGSTTKATARGPIRRERGAQKAQKCRVKRLESAEGGSDAFAIHRTQTDEEKFADCKWQWPYGRPPARARPRRLHRRRHPARSKSRRFALCGIDRIDVIKKSSEWAEYQNNLGFIRRRDSS